MPASLVVSMSYRQGSPATVLTQLPAGAPMVAAGPPLPLKLLNGTLVPAWRRPTTDTTPVQLAGASIAPPSLPAAATTSTPALIAALIALCSVEEHGTLAPRLRLMILAAGLEVMLPASTVTACPDAHMIPAAMSDTRPEHTPIPRTGSSVVFGAMPAMPMPLLAIAPITPATLVPFKELSDTVVQPASMNSGSATSAVEIQSPGSEASACQPSPSLA